MWPFAGPTLNAEALAGGVSRESASVSIRRGLPKGRICWPIAEVIDLRARAGNVLSMPDETDLFGHAAAQGSLFGPGEDRMQPPVQSYLPDPEKVRQRLRLLLEKARAAKTMPWPERDARMWQIVFPNMANWLPDDEAEQLRFEFAREMERLRQAA